MRAALRQLSPELRVGSFMGSEQGKHISAVITFWAPPSERPPRIYLFLFSPKALSVLSNLL